MRHLNPTQRQSIAPCPSVRECGGCPWMERSLVEQHERKLRKLTAALGAKHLSFPEPCLIRAGSSLGYRNRLRLRVDQRAAAVFFNPNKLSSCAVLDPALGRAVSELRARGALGGLVGARHLELRVGDDRRVGLCVYSDALPAEATQRALCAELPEDWRIGFAGVESLPTLEYYLEDTLGAGLRYAVPISSFVQVNSAVNRALIGHLRELVRQNGLTSFNDLFCGAGNFTLPLLADGLSGESIEADPLAIRELEVAASRTTPRDRAAAHTARVADAREFVASLQPRELLLANPPRAGLKLDAGAALRLASRATRFLALVSCSPNSLARDLAQLLPCGFELRELRAFDMFPHTEHLESLAWLARR